MLNYEIKDRKENNYYNSWSKKKHFLVESTRLSIVKNSWTYVGFPCQYLKGKNSYITRVKKVTEKVIFTSCEFCKNKNQNNDKRCKFTFFCYDLLAKKIRYQHLGVHKKFGYFLSKFKDQIKMTGSYYMYFNDQTFSLQKTSIRSITFCKKDC